MLARQRVARAVALQPLMAPRGYVRLNKKTTKASWGGEREREKKEKEKVGKERPGG